MARRKPKASKLSHRDSALVRRYKQLEQLANAAQNSIVGTTTRLERYVEEMKELKAVLHQLEKTTDG